MCSRFFDLIFSLLLPQCFQKSERNGGLNWRERRLPMPKLTKRLLENAEVRERDYFIFDDELPGFGLRVMPSGRKIFVLQYRAGTKSRRCTIGPYPVMTPESARTQATKILAAVRGGQDPVGEKRARALSPTVKDLAARYEKEHCALHIKPSTRENYKLLLKKYILPAIGHIKVTDVTRADIANLHHSMSDRPTNANRMLEVVSKMFNLAELWGWRADGTNPRRHIKKYKENKRDRYLTIDEIKRLGEALHMAEEANLASIYAIAAFRLLVLTGARLNEIQTCKWEYVCIDQNLIRLPDSKTGPRFIHLGRTATLVLRNIPRKEGNPYVICSDHFPGEHVHDLQKTWQMLRGWAGLKDVRIHDLRHTFASSAVGMGMSLPIIGKMLGHTQTQTTARYAHLAVSPVLDAATEVTGHLGELLALPAPAADDTGDDVGAAAAGHQTITIIPPLKQKLGEASQFLTSDEAARYLGVQQRLMENWRWRRTGPKFIKIGNRIRYTMEDLQVFVGRGQQAHNGQNVVY